MVTSAAKEQVKNIWNIEGDRLANGVGAGSLARIYRENELRFAQVLEVDTKMGFNKSSLGLKPNVRIQYLDGAQEQVEVYGNIVLPLTRGWIEDMKDRFEDIKMMFHEEPGQPVEKKSPAKLRNGVTAGSLVRVYKHHALRFARVKQVLQSFPTQPNVALTYLDGDREFAKVFGSVIRPVSAEWVEALQNRLTQAEAELRARREAQQRGS